jgi:hypothetical protein
MGFNIDPTRQKYGEWVFGWLDPHQQAWMQKEDQLTALIGLRTITATGAGVYTPTPGTQSIVVEIVGGGGGGGSAIVTAAGNCSGGAGGGGGGYCKKRYTSGFAGAAYSVGIGGAGGAAAAANAGAVGGNTTFLAMTASGGVGGPATGAATALGPASGAVAGGAAAGGDLNIPGEPGDTCNRFVATTIAGGLGGSSQLGSGGTPVGAIGLMTFAGGAGRGYGGGGSGAASAAGGAGAAGGNGSPGVLIIEEYS